MTLHICRNPRYSWQLPTFNRKGGDTDKVVIIPVEAANYIMGQALHASVSTTWIEDMENTLICDGGATCTPTKCLENCSVCKPKKVEIQTTHGMSLMKTTHLCYKTFATDWEKYDQLLLKNMWYWDWNMIYYQSGDSIELVMLCTTIQTQKNQGYTTWYVIINKIDTAKSFPFMSKHTNPFIWI